MSQLQAEGNLQLNCLAALRDLHPQLSTGLAKQGVTKVTDLATWLPLRYITRPFNPPVLDFKLGEEVILELEVEKHCPNNFQNLVIVKCSYCKQSGFAPVDLCFMTPKWQAREDYFGWLQKKLPPQSVRYAAGKLRKDKKNCWQLVNPSYLSENASAIPLVEPVYPKLLPFTNRRLCEQVRQLLPHLPDLSEWLPQSILDKYSFQSWRQAVLALHLPSPDQTANSIELARQRLAFDELLAKQLELALCYQSYTKVKQQPLVFTSQLKQELASCLPFTLREDQQQVVEHIYQDIAKPTPMLRLIQGEVGSGKTIIALLAALAVAAQGKQVALLAPTVILAEQHYQSLLPLAVPRSCSIGLLTRATTAKQRQQLEQQLASGEVQIVVGTHGLLEKSLQFKTLRLAIIDEQQRFGVFQRSALCRGGGVDLLMLSATPIPRTQILLERNYMQVDHLTATSYRGKVQTSIICQDQWTKVIKKLKPLLNQGKQAYWVCSQVKKTATPVTAAKERLEQLGNWFPAAKLGLLHGAMAVSEKQAVIEQFKQKKLAILVTTTVVEVGLDLPQVSIMIIEDAERFGLVQLHQLRGRIGRDGTESYCLLLTKRILSSKEKLRLSAVKKYIQSFEIASLDLEQRGPGQLYGTLQSGKTPLAVATASDLEKFLPEVNKIVAMTSPEQDRPAYSNLLKIYQG